MTGREAILRSMVRRLVAVIEGPTEHEVKEVVEEARLLLAPSHDGDFPDATSQGPGASVPGLASVERKGTDA